MKHIAILLVLLIKIAPGQAQYNKDKLTDILTGGSTKAWSVKALNIERPERSFTFNTNGSVQVELDNGKGPVTQAEKWSLTTTDNIRWFISIGGQSFELIISYDKNGGRYVKLTHKAGDSKASAYYEINLYPLK